MKFPKNIRRFTREEDGSLLVFFCISIIVILGIFALSFDMGRRASTQTDMQSFADNVALAAAGELDGSANAITNAQAAATSVIIAANENLKAGTGAANLTITFDVNNDLVFYTDLPDQDRPGTFDPAVLGDATNANYKYNLPTANTTTDPLLARYVGVTLATTDVDWLFAGVVSNNAPDAAVGALAIAGNAGYTCEIAPLMFCLPRDGSGNVQALTPGIAVQLQTVGNGAAWNPGQFGYLDVSSIPDSVSGTCAGETPESRFQACLLAQGITACFTDSGVDIQTGQRGGQEPAGFNLPFGIFGQAMNNLRNDPIYAVGPHTISGQELNGGCRATNASLDTMAFPSDDCHTAGTGGTNICTGGRFGDGTWTAGRADYVDTNYRHMEDIAGTPTEIQPGSFFDFPETGLSRYQYYLREIERAATGGLMDPAGEAIASGEYIILPDHSQTDDDGGRGGGPADPTADYDSWDDYWPDTLPASGYNPIIPDAQDRDDDGLPQCSNVGVTPNADRRVVVVAGIDCPPAPDNLTGDEDDVPVEQYYEVFLIAPARDASGSTEGPGGGADPIFELYVEIIQPIGGEGGGSTATDSAFREVVQLYR